MIEITNGKIASLAPTWAEFRGFSLLLDNPAGCVREDGDLEHIDCGRAAAGACPVYEGLRDVLADLGGSELAGRFGFCPLPSDSYHVTFLDGVSRDNLTTVLSVQHENLKSFVAAIETELPRPPAALQSWIAPALPPVLLKFDELVVSPGLALVACLTPESACRPAFDRMREARMSLAGTLRAEVGVTAGPNWMPHVSLGYFANADGAREASRHLNALGAAVADAMRGAVQLFEGASLYGFSDMATFFRAKR